MVIGFDKLLAGGGAEQAASAAAGSALPYGAMLGIGSEALGLADSQPLGSAASSKNQFNDRTYINVAPVGTNLGEILSAFTGPPENGGFGLERNPLNLAAFNPSFRTLPGSPAPSSFLSLRNVAIFGGLAVAAFFIIRAARRGR